MIRPDITIFKKSALIEPIDGATIEKTAKQAKKPCLRIRHPSTNPIFQKALGWTDKSPRERVHLRTREITALAGHAPLDVTQGDYEQAKREVTGETILRRQNLILDPGSV